MHIRMQCNEPVLKGIYRRFTWGDRPKTTKLSHFNATLFISVDLIANDQ